MIIAEGIKQEEREMKFLKGIYTSNFLQNLFKNRSSNLLQQFLALSRKQHIVGLKFSQRLFSFSGDGIFILHAFDFFKWQVNQNFAMNK